MVHTGLQVLLATQDFCQSEDIESISEVLHAYIYIYMYISNYLYGLLLFSFRMHIESFVFVDLEPFRYIALHPPLRRSLSLSLPYLPLILHHVPLTLSIYLLYVCNSALSPLSDLTQSS